MTASLPGGGTSVAKVGARPPPTSASTTRGPPMNLTTRRWYSVLLLRDALGRFTSLRQQPAPQPRPVRRPRRPRVRLEAVQLVLF